MFDDDFWKIAGALVGATAAYFIGRNNGENRTHEKYARDREIDLLSQQIKALEDRRDQLAHKSTENQ